jgi:hypothetical protein
MSTLLLAISLAIHAQPRFFEQSRCGIVFDQAIPG